MEDIPATTFPAPSEEPVRVETAATADIPSSSGTAAPQPADHVSTFALSFYRVRDSAPDGSSPRGYV